MRKILTLLFLPLIGQAQNFEADDASPRQLTVDQDSLYVDLAFKPAFGLVNGKVTIWVHEVPTDSIFLDAKPSIEVHGAPTLNGEEVEWRRDDQGIILKPKVGWGEGRIDIEYTARPFKGVYFNGWEDETGVARRQIFTQGQGIDHRHWLPHQDAQNDKLKTSFTITFDSNYEVLGNGVLTSKVERGNQTAWTYAMQQPHSSYLLAFVVGKYNETVVAKTPFRANYMYPDLDECYSSTYYENEKVWNYLNDRIGYPFAWSAYRQAPVANFPHGAMENTCMTIFSENFISTEADFDDLNYVYVNAHELAHHWFGDLVTVPSSHDFWLHEGFATYYQMEAERAVFGDEHYTEEWIKALQLSRQANAADAFPLQHSKAGSSRFYQLGALTIRALEHEIGTEVFDAAILDYLERYAFKLVTTDSLKSVLEEHCECSLSPFFEAYVANPHSVIMHVDVSGNADGRIEVDVLQDNEWGTVLPMNKVEVRLWTNSNEYRDTLVSFSDSNSQVMFALDDVYAIEFDPNHRYPVKWDVEMTDELIVNSVEVGTPYTQAILSPTVDMDSDIFADRFSTLIESGSPLLRDSILVQLSVQKPRNFEKWMVDILEVSDFSNAKLFVSNYPNSEYSRGLISKLTALISNKEKTSDATALRLGMTIISLEQNGVLIALNELEERDGGVDYNIALFKAFLTAVVKGKSDAEGLPKLVTFAGTGYADNVRQEAWGYLSQAGYSGKDLRDLQYAELVSRHRHLRNAAVRAVKGYLSSMDADQVTSEISFVLRNAHPDDIARVERILGIELEIE